ncbi:MAG: zinc ribbon domain-containing protein [Candidatus Eremiobacteraeota bacterium]|nr:zinc ribbon domain-containing protein [Candidatus Eremiobacteraeota bacterium]
MVGNASEPEPMNPWREIALSAADGEPLSALYSALGSISGSSGWIENTVLFKALAVPSLLINGKAGTEPGGSWKAFSMSFPSGSLVKLVDTSGHEMVFYRDAEGNFYSGSLTQGGEVEKAFLIYPEESAENPSLLITNRAWSQSAGLKDAPAGFPWTAAPLHWLPEGSKAEPIETGPSSPPPPPSPSRPACAKCGARLKEGHKFCVTCGTKYEAHAPPPPPPAAPSRPACAKCGARLKQGHKFCVTCGTKYEAPAHPAPPPAAPAPPVCAKCGARLKEGDKFCVGCGAKCQQLPHGQAT